MPPPDAIMNPGLIGHHLPSRLADGAASARRCDARLWLEQIGAASVTRLISPHPIRSAGK